MMEIFDSTLWIYTSIIGALLGAAFLAYSNTAEIEAKAVMQAHLDMSSDEEEEEGEVF